MSPEFIFILSGLAVWRISHLLNKEDGPFDIIYLVRKKAGAGFFGGLLDCFYCVSVWVAFVPGICLGNNWWQKLLLWWALSGMACLLEQATTLQKKKENDLPDYKED